VKLSLDNLLNAWPLLLGYPAIAAALLLGVLAVRKRRAVFSVIACLLIAPLSLYVLGSPTYWWVGALVPAILIVMSVLIALRNRRARIAQAVKPASE
jgi:CHASE2 domain-containing sensor protein